MYIAKTRKRSDEKDCSSLSPFRLSMSFLLLFSSTLLQPQFLDRLITDFFKFAISAGFCDMTTAGKRWQDLFK